jgi:hypothetical protein
MRELVTLLYRLCYACLAYRAATVGERLWRVQTGDMGDTLVRGHG